jgi:hypothetical protein
MGRHAGLLFVARLHVTRDVCGIGLASGSVGSRRASAMSALLHYCVWRGMGCHLMGQHQLRWRPAECRGQPEGQLDSLCSAVDAAASAGAVQPQSGRARHGGSD